MLIIISFELLVVVVIILVIALDLIDNHLV